MQKALLDGEIVSHLTVMSSYNVRDPKAIHRLKLASSHGKLTCIDCGEPVRFRYGGKFKYAPHFSHFSGAVCSMEGHTPFESEAHENCIAQLYFYFREMGIPVEIDKPLDCKRRANLYLGSEPDGIAVEVVANSAGFKALCNKLDDYRIKDIKNLWVLCAENPEEFVSDNEAFIYPILENGNDKPLIILNESAERLTLLRRTEFRDSSNQLVRDKYILKDYAFRDIRFSYSGNRFETDFESVFEQERVRFESTVVEEIQREAREREERKAKVLQLEKQLREQRAAEAKERVQRANQESELRKYSQGIRASAANSKPHIPSAGNTSVDRAKLIVDRVISGRIGPSDILFFEGWINDRWKDYVELGYTCESMYQVVCAALQKPGLHIQSQLCLKRVQKTLKNKMDQLGS